MSKEKKEPTIKDLKVYAFDLEMKIKQMQQEYNNVIKQIAIKQNEPKAKRPIKKAEPEDSNENA